MQLNWYLVSDFEIIRKSWGDETVIYHTGSGDTQLLDEVSVAVLDTIQSFPMNTVDILKEVNKTFAIELTEEVLLTLLQKLSLSGVLNQSSA